jgi:hypothetical protein
MMKPTLGLLVVTVQWSMGLSIHPLHLLPLLLACSTCLNHIPSTSLVPACPIHLSLHVLEPRKAPPLTFSTCPIHLSMCVLEPREAPPRPFRVSSPPVHVCVGAPRNPTPNLCALAPGHVTH